MALIGALPPIFSRKLNMNGLLSTEMGHRFLDRESSCAPFAVTSSNASMGSGPRADAGRGLCKDQELDYQRAGEASAMAGFSFRRRSISDFFVRVLSALSTGKRFDASK